MAYLGPVVSDLFQVLSALSQTKAGSLVLNRTFAAAKFLGDEDVRVRAIKLLQGIDLRRRPILNATGSVKAAARLRRSVPTSRTSGLPCGGVSSPAIHPLLLSNKDSRVNSTSS